MADLPHSERVLVDGRFFRLGRQKFYCKGITYGPFAPNAEGETFAPPQQTARDFEQIKSLNSNVVRVYYVPPKWFLDLAQEHGLKILVDIPWAKHLCFLDSAKSQREARSAVRSAVLQCAGHPAVFAFSVANEIPAEIVRWSGGKRVESFINELVIEAKQADPGCLCTFASFPPTEFLQPESIDFVCFNVYLHARASFESYLARLQTLASAKPLLLGEFGMDSIRNGVEHQAEFLDWQIELAFRAGVAGTVVFSFTDDWYRGGVQIEDWGFGVTMRSRAPKPAFTSLQRQYGVAPHLPLARSPKVTIVVATYNGARTLRNCLESLRRLNYPDYEVVLVDDGSTDDTPVIAAEFPFARYVRQNNQGLSVARNTGIVAARGEIVAFTDDDCRADEDWLYYLVSDLQRGGFQGVGGHNFLPPEDSPIAASVMVSPGGPAHILIDDREAEHVPGCNMAFYKTALEHIGLFDPVFRKAGDDVDVCWRLQEAGYRLGFSPSGFVWHYRRSTVKAYLKQQAGYGEAEGLLIRKHPEHFNSFGGGLWKGRIYASAYSGLLLRGPVIYRGVFATGFFQRLYTPDPVTPLLLCTGLGYHVFVNLPLAVLAAYFSPAIPMALFSLSVSVGACALAAFQAPLPSAKSRFWSRPLIGLLFFLQPIVRGWARLKWTMASQANATSGSTGNLPERPEETIYWSGGEIGRLELLHALIDRLRRGQWNLKTDTGWSDYDLELPAHLWVRLRLTTVSEELDQGRRNLRCRIRFLWSLPARMTFWSATLISLFLIERLAQTTPWIWFILPLLPLIAWWLEDEAQTQRAALGRELDAAAQDLHLVQIDPVPQEASLGEQRSPKHCSDSPPS